MPILEVDNVVVRFGEFTALRGVSVAVERGERLAIVGPNGAGKTTLINVITGYVVPVRGRVLLEGRDVTKLPPWVRARLGVSRSFQLPRLFLKQSVVENVAAAVAARRRLESRLLRSASDVLREAMELLKLVHLDGKAWMPASSLSAGERKVLDALMALALKPKVLVLDEPTSGVATEEKHEVLGTMLKAAESMGATVVFVEHDLELVREYATRAVAIVDGEVVAEGEPSRVLEHPVVREHLGGEVG